MEKTQKNERRDPFIVEYSWRSDGWNNQSRAMSMHFAWNPSRANRRPEVAR